MKLLQCQKRKLQQMGIEMMYRQPTEYFEKTLQTQEPKTYEGNKIDMTEVTLDQEVSVNSQELHLLMLFT